ncbi:MAG: signal peptidase I [Candidatus Vogelbacteria bacterium]|nr:signal peptidase I [Candidatus Vogelbacteria bacterium]
MNEEDITMWGFIKEILKFTTLSLIIVIPIRTFIAQPFLVSGSSMKPTFMDGEYLIVDELSYNFKIPERGQVVVFKYPNDPSKYFIKRIIGLPGELIDVQNGQVVITNAENRGGFKLEEPYINKENWGYRNIKMQLSSDDYFVMGDNRNASSDSREWGALNRKFLTGKVALRLLPISRAEASPGSIKY